MSYSLTIKKNASKALSKLPQEDYENVRDAIRSLAQTPRPTGCKKLTGREGWRIRIGTYRVIYQIDDSLKNITILSVGHRKDVYR